MALGMDNYTFVALAGCICGCVSCIEGSCVLNTYVNFHTNPRVPYPDLLFCWTSVVWCMACKYCIFLMAIFGLFKAMLSLIPLWLLCMACLYCTYFCIVLTFAVTLEAHPAYVIGFIIWAIFRLICFYTLAYVTYDLWAEWRRCESRPLVYWPGRPYYVRDPPQANARSATSGEQP